MDENTFLRCTYLFFLRKSEQPVSRNPPTHLNPNIVRSFNICSQKWTVPYILCMNCFRLEHPVKRLKKGDSKLESKPAYNPSKHMPASEHLLAKVRAERDTPPSPATPAHDPYEFSDEASSTPGEFSKRGSLRQSREDSITRPNSFITKLVNFSTINKLRTCYEI